MLPKQLQNEAFGFVKLKPKTKIPFEKEWQKKPCSYLEIQRWIDAGNNYGIIGGIGDLIIIDTDDIELADILFAELPETFTVKASKGYHFYFIVHEKIDNYNLNKNGKHYGEIRANGLQTVGPNCTHPSGIKYVIERDLPIHIFL
jgi:hypothetical protein